MRQRGAQAYFVGSNEALSRNRGCHSARAASRNSFGMKILTFTTVYPNPKEPGLGIFIRRRIQAMSKLAKVKVVAPVPIFNYQRRAFSLKGSIPFTRDDDGVEVIAPRWFYPPGLNGLNPFFLYSGVRPAISRLRQTYQFDVIDAHFAHPDGVAATMLAEAFRCPFTITLRGNELEHSKHPSRRRRMSWALRRAAYVIAVANPLRELALELGVEPQRVSTIPNGVDTAIFHPRDRDAMRAKYAVPPSSRLIVSAGNLIELKGHQHTMQSVRSLSDAGTNVTLFVAGRGSSYEPTLRALVSQLKLEQRVRFLGQVSPEALAELMCAADVFCLASSREGWPNVVHESLACGTPVVATRVGGAPEMIPSDDFGILVPPNDTTALTEALRSALSKEWNCEHIAAWGQSRSWDQVASEVMRVFERIVAKPG